MSQEILTIDSSFYNCNLSYLENVIFREGIQYIIRCNLTLGWLGSICLLQSAKQRLYLSSFQKLILSTRTIRMISALIHMYHVYIMSCIWIGTCLISAILSLLIHPKSLLLLDPLLIFPSSKPLVYDISFDTSVET